MLPSFYPLNFYTQSHLGLPFYHFRSDWETDGTLVNFTNENNQPAQVGDNVKIWKNAYLPTGQGDAAVPPVNMNGGNYWTDNYPTLVETTYPGYLGNPPQTYKGLKFTGTEYMQIEGRTVTQPQGITETLFSTGGTSLMTGKYKESGASFLFVLDSDLPETYDAQGNFTGFQSAAGYDPSLDPADGFQLLLYSRQRNDHPLPVTTGPFPTFPTGYTWPTDTEDYGLQLWFNAHNVAYNYPDVWWGITPKLGPQGVCTTPALPNFGMGADAEMLRPGPDPTAVPPYGHNDGTPTGAAMPLGGMSSTRLLTTVSESFQPYGYHPGAPYQGDFPNPPAQDSSPVEPPRMERGFQVLLFEIDNTDYSHYGGQITWYSGYEAYTGPAIKMYTYGNTEYASELTDPVWGRIHSSPLWDGGNSLVKPRAVGFAAAAIEKILFSEHLLFLAGAPPWLGEDFPPDLIYGNKYAHGFRGIIYEAMMFEGKLSDTDKLDLEEIFKRKYQGAIRTPNDAS